MKRALPQLRHDVQIVRTGPENFVLTQPGTSRRLLFSTQERNLLRLCDGHREVDEIGREYRRQFGTIISRRHLREFIEQLHQEGLLTLADGTPESAGASGNGAAVRHEGEGPEHDAQVRRLYRRFYVLVLLLGFLLYPIWALPIVAMSIIGITILVQRLDNYVLELTGLFLAYPAWILVPISLVQTILFLNLPRELLVGMACRRFGGWVRHFGLFWIGGVLPFFYCDRGDLLSVRTGRGRWTILLTGLWADMLVGSLMAIGWAMTGPGMPHRFCLLQLLPWVVGMFLRANIFVPLDGYKILCVIFEEPRIRERAVAETGAWLRLRRSPEALSDRERFWLRCYGLGWHAWMWCLRLLYIVGGLWWLTFRLGGLGALIGVTAILLWYRHAIWSFFMPSTGTDWVLRSGGQWWIRWPVRIVVLAGIIALGFIPYAHEVSGDCWVVPGAEQGLRAQIADEIVKVHVQEMQAVKAGDPIVTFSGRDIIPEVDRLKAELAQAQAELDKLVTGARDEDVAMAEQEVELWRIRLAYSETELARVKNLHESKAANDDELRQTKKEYDSTQQLLLSSQEKLKRTREGAREEELRAGRAKVDSQKAKLAQAESKLKLLTIAAPIDGRVVTPDVRQRLNHFTSPGDLIATIQDTSHVRVEVAADETAALLKPGMKVNCRFRGLDGTLVIGTVQALASAAMPSSDIRVEPVRTDHEALIEKRSDWEKDSAQMLVYVDLANPQGLLLPGMTGQARVVVNQDDLLWRAVWRPIARFFRVDVWSWLP